MSLAPWACHLLVYLHLPHNRGIVMGTKTQRFIFLVTSPFYKAFKPSDVQSKYGAISWTEACVTDLTMWMNGNLLKLNDDNIKLSTITTHEDRSNRFYLSVNAGNQSISPNDDPTRNLWVIFDSIYLALLKWSALNWEFCLSVKHILGKLWLRC